MCSQVNKTGIAIGAVYIIYCYSTGRVSTLQQIFGLANSSWRESIVDACAIQEFYCIFETGNDGVCKFLKHFIPSSSCVISLDLLNYEELSKVNGTFF